MVQKPFIIQSTDVVLSDLDRSKVLLISSSNAQKSHLLLYQSSFFHALSATAWNASQSPFNQRWRPRSA